MNLVPSALVTGASRGIGRSIALSLAKSGFALTITSRRDEALAELEEVLLAAGAPSVRRSAGDVADREHLAHLVDLHRAEFGSMHALVINAGVGTAGSIADFPLERTQKLLDVNFIAGLVLMQHSLPLLRAGAAERPETGAKVIALSSITGAYAERDLATYGASKAALLSLVETFNLEECENGVTATALAPGYVNTEMAAWVTDRVPASTMIPVDDVVRVVDMLLSLSPASVISRMVIARSGSGGHTA